MKAYLGLSRTDSTYTIRMSEDPREILLEPGGRASPVYSIDGQQVQALRGDETITTLFPISPRSLLAAIATARSRDSLGGVGVYVTHGLGAVVCILPAGTASEAWVGRWAEYITAAESWPLQGGRLDQAFIKVFEPERRADPFRPRLIPVDADFPDEVAGELEQFNRNISYFWSRAERFAPEFRTLVDALIDAVESSRDAILENLTRGGDARFAQPHYVGVANLVEVNSCLTMLTSQALSGTAPLLETSFSVGEYSLFGIGTATRAVWALYSHISKVFAEENQIDRLRELSAGPAFDPSHQAPYALDVSTWDGKAIDEFEAPSNETARQHVIYFSSRWGFHQTMQSISISWQCLVAGASPDWNLLTFSHEFLHSHLRELLDELLLDPSRSVEDLVKLFNRTSADTWGESAVQLLVSELRWMRNTSVLQSNSFNGGGAGAYRQRKTTDAAEVGLLIRDYMRNLEELVVHVMDFVYFYASDENVFVSSLWHSWALVPNVQPHLKHYLVRTLLALSSNWTGPDSEDAFRDAATRLNDVFDDLLSVEPHGLIREAQQALTSDPTRRSLLTLFQGSFVLVRFITRYLISARINSRLLSDGQSRDDGTYGLGVGAFTHDPLGSPYGFLLDAFKEYEHGRARDEVERHTLWQFLAIT